MNLGFGVTDQSIGARLPARFLAGRTYANGIDMQSFLKGHPELSRYMGTESTLGMWWRVGVCTVGLRRYRIEGTDICG